MDAATRFNVKISLNVTKQDGTPFHNTSLEYTGVGIDDVLAVQEIGKSTIEDLHAYGKSKGIAAK